MVTTRLFEEPIEAVESSEQTQVTFANRLFCCAGASLVGIIPAVAATYSAFQVTHLFRSFTNPENANRVRVVASLSVFNTPLIFALGISALLAFAIAITLATDSRRRQASVGFLFAIFIPVLGTTPAVLLRWAESTTLDVLQGKHINTPIHVVAQTVSNLLFWAIATGMLVPVVIFVSAVVSLCIPVRVRMEPSSLPRAFVWGAVGMLLLVFAGVYFALI